MHLFHWACPLEPPSHQRVLRVIWTNKRREKLHFAHVAASFTVNHSDNKIKDRPKEAVCSLIITRK